MPKTGCKCRECFGFAEFMVELTGEDYGLLFSPKHPHGMPACDGSMTCECPMCGQDKARANRRVVQPWEARKPR